MNRPLALLVLAAVFAVPLAAKAAQRPNILYLYVDDMGWGSIGPNGQAVRKLKQQPSVLTPNLDKLAAEGVNFTRAYGCTVCSPARSSQQLGFHQGHTFADRNDPDNAKKAMRADDVTMGDALSAAGYVTGYWGKWGYGGSKDRAAPVIDNIQTLPTSHGYQFVLAELHHVRAHTFFQPTLWSAPAPAGAIGGITLIPNSMAAYAGNSAYPNLPANHNHPDYPATGYCDDAYAFAALDFVRAQAKHYRATGQPFFGLLAVQIPHAPFGEIAKLPEWSKAYENDPHFSSLPDQAQQWAAMVTRIDAHFGNILAALDDPNGDGNSADSVADDTLVIFMSDNGGPGGASNTVFDSNGGLRGNKGSIYEGGIRVPTIIRWPGKITANSPLQAGTNSDMVLDVSDLLPTFCDLTGVASPVGIDGVSIAPTLLGSGHQRLREFLIHEAGNSQSIIRGKHKLVRSASTGKGRKRGESTPTLALYDLDADRAETEDIAAANPKLVRELAALLLAERVAEPRGFANTYHRWTGADGAVISDPDNWSEYRYANAGITYLADTGAPRVSWNAVMENTGDKPAIARADADLEFLGLEIRGNAKSAATQELVVAPKVTLAGRNEIRLGCDGMLTLLGGKVSSLRWLDIHAGATLRGVGSVDADLHNAGAVRVASAASGPRRLTVSGDYHERLCASLGFSLTATPNKDAQLLVGGDAILAGKLAITVADKFTPVRGHSFTLLRAKSIRGRFGNADDLVVGSNGTRFKIGYSDNAVTLSVQ
jgi:arylsulfatase A-like enzyme